MSATISAGKFERDVPDQNRHATGGRVCIVGLGNQGLDLTGRLLANPGRWQIVAVVDLATASYARFQSHFFAHRIPFFRSVEEALASRPADAVVVATTAPAHVHIAKSAINAGHTGAMMIEKPISTSLGEARSLSALIAQTGWPGRVAVGHYRRCSDVYAQVAGVIGTGELGALRRIVFARGGKLSMRGSHYIDLANWLFASPPLEILCELEATSKYDHRGSFYYDPAGHVQINYANGGVFQMDTVAGSRRYAPGMRLTFDHGEIEVDEPEYSVSIRTTASSRTFESLESSWHSRHLSWFENALAAVCFGSECQPCYLPDAIACLELIVAAHQSHRQGGAPISLPLPASADSEVLRIA